MTPDLFDTAFDIALESSGSTRVVAVRGDLDLVTSPRLAEILQDAVHTGASTMIVDLTEVTFLASAAMTVLVDAATTLPAPARFAVVADGAVTRRSLTLVGLDGVLSIHPTLMAALAATL